MSAQFVITAEPAHDLIRIKLMGLFDARTLSEFMTARQSAHAQLRCPPNAHLTLTDVRGIAIQTQEMVARWGAVLADPAYISRRLAFIAASTLARKQLTRAIGSRDARVFLDPVAAEAWVLAEPMPCLDQFRAADVVGGPNAVAETRFAAM